MGSLRIRRTQKVTRPANSAIKPPKLYPPPVCSLESCPTLDFQRSHVGVEGADAKPLESAAGLDLGDIAN